MAKGTATASPVLPPSDATLAWDVLWAYTRIMDTGCYCIALRGAARRVTVRYDEALAPIGVNAAQFSLLVRISHGAPVALTELARRTDLDRSTVGRNVRVLERLGLVAVHEGDDRREAAVFLSDTGSQAIEQGMPLWNEVQARIEARMGLPAAHAFRTALQSL